MDKAEATAVLEQQLRSFTDRGYAELSSLIDRAQGLQSKGSSGTTYNIVFNVFDDDGTNLRIVGSIDDGSGRAFMLPLTKTEIMKPTGDLT